MPDEKGGAVRLYPAEGNRIAVCEGLETALAVHELYKTPVWSVISTQGMKNFIPPEGIEMVGIFADNDINYAGHAAAYELAHKLSLREIKVEVLFPRDVGTDYLDVWNEIQVKQNKIDQINAVPY